MSRPKESIDYKRHQVESMSDVELTIAVAHRHFSKGKVMHMDAVNGSDWVNTPIGVFKPCEDGGQAMMIAVEYGIDVHLSALKMSQLRKDDDLAAVASSHWGAPSTNKNPNRAICEAFLMIPESRLALFHSENSASEASQIPSQVLDVVRFLAETWDKIDTFVYQHCDGDALMQYPVIQGTRNQSNLRAIGEQAYSRERIKEGVEWLLSQGPR